jgi:hypothetical protein
VPADLIPYLRVRISPKADRAYRDADVASSNSLDVRFKPDVILASTNQVMAHVQQATRTIPIVFTARIDSAPWHRSRCRSAPA